MKGSGGNQDLGSSGRSSRAMSETSQTSRSTQNFFDPPIENYRFYYSKIHALKELSTGGGGLILKHDRRFSEVSDKDSMRYESSALLRSAERLTEVQSSSAAV